MRAVKSKPPKPPPPEPETFEGVRRKLCNRTFALQHLHIGDKTLGKWIKSGKLKPICTGAKTQQWFDMDKLIDVMEEESPDLGTECEE